MPPRPGRYNCPVASGKTARCAGHPIGMPGRSRPRASSNCRHGSERAFRRGAPTCGGPTAAARHRSRLRRRSRRGAAERFFYNRPPRGDPVPDGRLIALFGALGRPLQGPVECPQEAPDMTRVILHAGDPLDQLGDPREGPEVGSESLRTGAPAQRRFDAGQLRGIQPRLPARAAHGPQGRASAPAPGAVPAHDALAADPQKPGDGTLRLVARGKQPCGLVATHFQAMKIPSWSVRTEHAPIIPRGRRFVTVLYEIL